MDSKVKPRIARRRYDASRRRAAAERTRHRITQAARELFLRRGYAATRMTDVADAAGVSLETVYASFGPKARLMRQLVEVALSGEDEPVPALERGWVRRTMTEFDAARKLEMFAHGARELQERVAPLWMVVKEAAASDPELKSLADELSERRAAHMRLLVADLEAAKGLRPNISKDAAADVIWALNSSEFFALLVAQRGWPAAEFESWLADALKRLLLPPPGNPAT